MIMKILPVSLVRQADAFTIEHEPIADIDLMERAASECFKWLAMHLPEGRRVKVFCGSGNNGGDGFAIARMLYQSGYPIEVFALAPYERMSESCRINFQRMKGLHAGSVHLPESESPLPELSDGDVVIDAIFGSGLTRPAEGFAATLIRHINESGSMVIAIDVPSGLYCDTTTCHVPVHQIIHADYTLTFAPPKLAFFFPENDLFVGNWQLLNIGIHPDFVNNAMVINFMTTEEDLLPLLRVRNKFAHKGQFGHALIIAGSAGKMGAAVLAGKAALRSGAGLVSVCCPQSGVNILQTTVPEAMIVADPGTSCFSVPPTLSPYSAIAVGPGLGTASASAQALKILIQESKIPIVFDADAINILADHKTWLGFIPKGSVFTPHPKEFERLAGKSGNHFERNTLQRDFSFRYQCFVVLKGAHTAITTPQGHCYFNTTGNPGMATGGSGDVLTGIIAGLLAQGYTALAATLLGVFLHGRAGDIGVEKHGYEALIAGDLIENLGKSFQSLYGKF